MPKNTKWFVVSAVLALDLLVLAACVGSPSSGGAESAKAEHAEAATPVKLACENGIMLGKAEDGVVSFKGIPYAKPPVGELRWKAPRAPEPSGAEIECFDFGHTALQYEWPSEPASYTPRSEDCLTLNIWEREGTIGSDEPKPVMVFFHGGAYGWGGTADPTYNGQNFAKAHGDVILVTCNYRLGLMSFADFSRIEGGETYTEINLALRDHIAALEWIQKNIAAFGGDPANVTIFGESAGAWSVTALVLSPKARGLFRRAIAQSGEVAVRDRKAAQEYADFIMEASGAKNMRDLLAIPGDEWIRLDRENHIADECCYVVADGDIIPDDPDKAFQDAAKSGVQMLLGSNSDEWNYFKEDSEGATDEEKFASWVEGMDEILDDARAALDEGGKAAIEELLEYEAALVPDEYATDAAVKAALAKSAFVSETWRYEILDYADRFADAGGKYARFDSRAVAHELDFDFIQVGFAHTPRRPEHRIGHVDIDAADSRGRGGAELASAAYAGDDDLAALFAFVFDAHDRLAPDNLFREEVDVFYKLRRLVDEGNALPDCAAHQAREDVPAVSERRLAQRDRAVAVIRHAVFPAGWRFRLKHGGGQDMHEQFVRAFSYPLGGEFVRDEGVVCLAELYAV